MKTFVLFSLAGMTLATAQVSPFTAFEPRNTGQTAEIEPSEAPKIVSKEKKVRSISYCALTEDRIWTSKDGKTMKGQLIAFEDLVADAPQGLAPTFPAVPTYPTVVSDEKIRMLINRKPVLVLVSLMSDSDRQLIESIRIKSARK